MSLLKKAWTVISIVGVAAAIYMWLEWGPKTGGDDAPIVMAGGSMRFFSFRGDNVFTKESKGWTHKEKGRAITRVDILTLQSDGVHYDTFNTTANKQVKIDLRYCAPGCASEETVTISTAQNSYKEFHLSCANLSNDCDMSGDASGDTNLLQHNKPVLDWKIDKITYGGTPYPCNNGVCYIFLHFAK